MGKGSQIILQNLNGSIERVVDVPTLDVLEMYVDATLLSAVKRSHVIIEDEETDDETMLKAANAVTSIARYVEAKRANQKEMTNPIEIDDLSMRIGNG